MNLICAIWMTSRGNFFFYYENSLYLWLILLYVYWPYFLQVESLRYFYLKCSLKSAWLGLFSSDSISFRSWSKTRLKNQLSLKLIIAIANWFTEELITFECFYLNREKWPVRSFCYIVHSIFSNLPLVVREKKEESEEQFSLFYF